MILEHIDKPLLRGNIKLIQIMEDVRNYIGPPLNLQRLPHGEYTEVNSDYSLFCQHYLAQCFINVNRNLA